MPEVLNLMQLVERLQQDFRSVVNETKRKYIQIKDVSSGARPDKFIERRSSIKASKRIN